MAYRSTLECVLDLEKNGHLVRVREEVNPYLVMAEIQRRAYEKKAPAILFEKVKGSPFPAVCNLFGTIDRCEFIFRKTLKNVKKVVDIKADPTALLKAPHKYLTVPFTAITALPLRALFKPVLAGKTTLSQLPQIHSWPMDGGAYITLPQVFTQDPDAPGPMKSNLGMYRVQLSGNDFIPDKELGLHYQIHRGIGVHHSKAIRRNEKLKVSIFVGGPPAHSFAGVMPLPEGLSELMFGGMFAGRNFRYTYHEGHFISTDADFCIVGTVDRMATKPEGPFGDHLGYYSLTHDFPLMEVEAVYHRKDAIWPFTVVGRPPQEDTSFGHLIHEVTAAMVPVSISGLKAMHAVDAAGVHPLLLAVGSERYVPYGKRKPQELLTIANAVLGFNQASLAKYLMITDQEDSPPEIHNTQAFMSHVLERIDFTRDLHFQTETTMDTLDYSGTGLNSGSKLVMAAAGDKIRTLTNQLPDNFDLPAGFSKPVFCSSGILAVKAPAFLLYNGKTGEEEALRFVKEMQEIPCDLSGIGMIVLTDDSEFTAAKWNNFLWVTFTRSNPSHDVYGIHAFSNYKHWGCKGPVVIDARIKPHHAPPLIEDPETVQIVNQMASKGGVLYGVI
ncbi:MAG: UbiD family decarboxylase [Bacteroidia bacterium]|nr:UbiD family decarboxylase [Bacteroidia bacterium]